MTIIVHIKKVLVRTHACVHAWLWRSSLYARKLYMKFGRIMTSLSLLQVIPVICIPIQLDNCNAIQKFATTV